MTRRVTRRELATLVGGAVVTAAMTGRREQPVRLPGVVGLAELRPGDDSTVTADAASAAMNQVLVAATGAEDARSAVRRLFSADDVVGVKLNCLGGRRMSPRPTVVGALVDLLIAGGVAPDRIILFDRSSRELERAGFDIRRAGDGPRCYGTDNDYDRLPTESGAIGSCFARLVSTTCTALLSFGVVKDHDLAGVSAGLKNWYGVIHNPNKYHDNHCDPYVADVVRHPFIRDKLRLTVLDGVTAQCHGGPAYRAGSVFDLGRIAASTDPVAIDLWAWREIDAERTRRGLPTLTEAGRPPRFLATAAGYGLGTADADDLVEVTA
ncbi:MAG: DUF362 domain-containing protein [Holophagae bacterium]